jgi:hypothetical protein
VRVQNDIPLASSARHEVAPALDDVLARGLQRAPERRIASAQHMALELAAAVPPAPATEVAAFVAELAEDLLRQRAALVSRVEQNGMPAPAPAPPPRRSRWIAGVLGLVLLGGAVAFAASRFNNRSLALPAAPRPAAPAPVIVREPPPAPEPPPPAPAPRRAAAKRPARSDHCKPPFIIRPDGTRQYKVECL